MCLKELNLVQVALICFPEKKSVWEFVNCEFYSKITIIMCLDIVPFKFVFQLIKSQMCL